LVGKKGNASDGKLQAINVLGITAGAHGPRRTSSTAEVDMYAVLLCALAGTPAADDRSGYAVVFPALGNFSRKVEAPKVAKGDKPEVYSQSAVYEWMGGRLEVLTITLARDAKFKEQYSAEAMKKEKAEKLEVNKRPAYFWDRMKADELEKVNCKLVVVLADDKVLVIEQRGAGLELPDVAKKLDFDKVIKALETPPEKPR
jgi:hypothetical protein